MRDAAYLHVVRPHSGVATPPTTSTRNDRTVVLSSCPGLLTPLRIENDPSMGERRRRVATLGPTGGRRRPRRPRGRRTRRRADRALLRRRHRPGDRTARRFQAIRRLIVYEPGVCVGGLVPADQVELIEQLVARGWLEDALNVGTESSTPPASSAC